MRKYLIIATAILAAILVMSLIKSWQARRAKAKGETLPKNAGIGMAHLIGALVGLAVFFVGAVALEQGASAPEGVYKPAQLNDGKVTSGGFADTSSGNN